ncbi:MAG: hypothetical protein MJK15_07765 [Colwellia sp.]|nr:hypothetical protein [Colwellia sp.]
MIISRILFLLFMFSFPSFAFAAGEGGMSFFSGVMDFFAGIWDFIWVTIPATVNQFFVWLFTYMLYLKFYFLKASLEFAHAVALGFLDMVNISAVVNSAIDSLPSDLKQVALDIRFFDGLTIIVEAAITRFVYQSTQ